MNKNRLLGLEHRIAEENGWKFSNTNQRWIKEINGVFYYSGGHLWVDEVEIPASVAFYDKERY